jgi:hypothetical protein
MKKIDLGDIAKDSVTGFQGMVIGRSRYLYNVDRLTLQPRELKDGKRQESRSFDEPGVEYISGSEVKAQVPSSDQFQVGDIVRDRITGFEGVVAVRTRWLSGCFTLSVQPLGLDKDGQPYDVKAFEEPDCMLVRSKDYKEPVRKVGGPKGDVKRFSR